MQQYFILAHLIVEKWFGRIYFSFQKFNFQLNLIPLINTLS